MTDEEFRLHQARAMANCKQVASGNTGATKQTCHNCRYGEIFNGVTGECRRHAPQGRVIWFEGNQHVSTYFPDTQGWCGDWDAKD